MGFNCIISRSSIYKINWPANSKVSNGCHKKKKVRDIRNDLSHTSPTTVISESEYRQKYNDIEMLLTILGYDDCVDEVKNKERQQLRPVPQNRKLNIAYKSCILVLVTICVIFTGAPCDPHQSKRYNYDDSCYDHDDGIDYVIEPNV